MNNTFSIRRTKLLFKKQWVELRKIYLGSIIMLAGILFVIYSFNLITRNGGVDNDFNLLRLSTLSFRSVIFAFAGLIYLSFMAGNYFYRYHTAHTGIQELTLPVSLTEKITTAFLSALILNVLGFIVVFLGIDAMFVTALRYLYNEVDFELLRNNYRDSFAEPAGFQYYGTILDRKATMIFSLAALVIPSVFLLGSIYFSKVSYIKTAIVAVCFFLLLVSAPALIRSFLDKGKISVIDYTDMRSFHETTYIIALLLAIGCFWVAIYYKLKEKEI